MPDANAQAPQDVANTANAAPAPTPTIVNPVDSFFDDYKVAVEADKARRPRARPRTPVQAQPAPVQAPTPQVNALPPAQAPAPTPAPQQESGWASRLSGEYGKAMSPAAKPAAPHVEAFGKAVAPPPPPPAFIKAEKKPPNPKLQEFLGSLEGDRLETMGQEFASLYAKDAPGGHGYSDDDLQQVYLGVQENLRDRVKKGYKLKTMDEARLFEED